MPRLTDPDPMLPRVFTTQDALARGLSRDQIRHRLRSGRWIAVHTATFVRASELEHLDTHEQQRFIHRARAHAAALRHPFGVIGGLSAAIVRSLPIWGTTPDRVTLIVPPGHFIGRRDGIDFRGYALSEAQWTGKRTRVTTPTRTWIDVARLQPLSVALAIGDGALRRGSFTPIQLERRLDECRILRAPRALSGLDRAERALAHLAATRESPLESASWAYFLEHNIPLPEMQVELFDERGRLMARVDFLWRNANLVGECDGQLKYAADPGAALYKEKRRQERLYFNGYDAIRWGASDLHDGQLANAIMLRLKRHAAA